MNAETEIDARTIDPDAITTPDECEAAIAAAQKALNSTRQQLDEAMADGWYDQTWDARAKAAARALNSTIQRLFRRRGELAKEQRAREHSRLVRDQFGAMWGLLTERYGKETADALANEALRRAGVPSGDDHG